MTRTVQWPSVVLNIGKWRAVMALVLAYDRQKDAFLRDLAKTTRWGDLDKPRDFRNRDKKTWGNFGKLPIHLYDRALFVQSVLCKRLSHQHRTQGIER